MSPCESFFSSRNARNLSAMTMLLAPSRYPSGPRILGLRIPKLQELHGSICGARQESLAPDPSILFRLLVAVWNVKHVLGHNLPASILLNIYKRKQSGTF